jgi:diguanylate cyclase (GGDEF)-like protein
MNAESRQQQWCDSGWGSSTSVAPPEPGLGDRETAVFDLLDSAAGNDVRALRAVLRVDQAVLGAQHFDDALEVIAEQTLKALDAASFSISRWERQRGVLRTLINVGELGPGEERWPRDEVYPLADYRYVTDLLRQGLPYVNSIDNEDEDAALDVWLLRRLNKESELAVPVMYESAMWGELWATGTRGRRFGPDDICLLTAIAAQVSVAIGRAELFSEVSRHAYEDPLTRLANRRGFDECLRQCEDGNGGTTLLLCDLDGLKQINDRDGHPAGDRLLRGVADALSDVASEFRATLVARLGGDEFCVILPTPSLTDAQRFACTASRRIARELGPDVSLCWGVAARDADTGTAHELITKADAALVDAKRLGPGRLRLHMPGERGLPGGSNPRRRFPASRRRATDDLVPRFVELVDQRRPPTTLAALELLAGELSHAVNAAAWSISATTDDMAGLRTVLGVEAALDAASGLRVVERARDEVYPLADYAATARAITQPSAFIAGIDAPGSDPAEIEVLRDLGYRAVLGVGTFDRQRGYLLEIYSDGDHAELAAIAPVARVLAHYCVRAVTGRPTLQVGHDSIGAVAGGSDSEIAEESRNRPSQRGAAMTSLRLDQPAQPMHAAASTPKSLTGPRRRSEMLG